MLQAEYEQEFQAALADFHERAIVVQSQLAYAINTGDWHQAGLYLVELGDLHKVIGRAAIRAAHRREKEQEPLQQLLLAVVHRVDEFEHERLIQLRRQVIDRNGKIALFVKHGIDVPPGFANGVAMDVIPFLSIEQLNDRIAAYLGSRHWFQDERGNIQVFGHAARRIVKEYAKP